MAITIDTALGRLDWSKVKADLADDDFDNGRSPDALRLAFERSQHVAMAHEENNNVVGMARLLSDGVSNAYLLDVWTASSHRRQGIATRMIRELIGQVPGQHIGLQTSGSEALYLNLGFRFQPQFMALVVGEWLDNEANQTGL
jgi:ribosomal protein S18 acetylase RimI-like enzyme